MQKYTTFFYFFFVVIVFFLQFTTSISLVMDIIKFLVFFLFFLSSPVNSDNLCPVSYCPNNNLPIKYPFRLEGHQTPNCSYTDLKCTSQGAVILNLPDFGDFYVRDIHYGDNYPLILLYDPQNCLSKRIMGSNFLSFFPGEASDFQDYTFYSCPYDLVAWKKLPTISCLSNSSSAAVAIRVDLVQRKREMYRCREIVTSSMPVSRRDPPEFIEDERELVLQWFANSCRSCPYVRRGKPYFLEFHFSSWYLLPPSTIIKD